MSRTECERVRSLLDPFIDDELAAEEQREVERHVRACPECQRELDELGELGAKLRVAAFHKAPAKLVSNVQESLRRAESRTLRPGQMRRWPLTAASHLAAAVAGAVAVYLVVFSQADFEIASREIVAAHVRSLMGQELTQVASGDPHKVGPWFSGKVDFAPRPRDLSEHGFPLIGGRVEYFQGARAAVLVFRRRAHTINVFVLPRSNAVTARAWRRNGYNIRRWSNADLQFWAISDLNANELADLARLLGET
jgi:anti-sigma factor RsiW